MADDKKPRKFVKKNESVILAAVADITQAKVAEAMGKGHASYVSTFLSGKQSITFGEMLGLLEGAGLAVHRCTEEYVIVPTEDFKATLCYAKRYWTEREC